MDAHSFPFWVLRVYLVVLAPGRVVSFQSLVPDRLPLYGVLVLARLRRPSLPPKKTRKQEPGPLLPRTYNQTSHTHSIENNTIGGGRPRPMTMEAAPERRKRMNMTHASAVIKTHFSDSNCTRIKKNLQINNEFLEGGGNYK